MSKGFARRGWYLFSKLGRGRKKKMKWRAPLGRHGKMREKRGGADKTVMIGYGTKDRKLITVVSNLKELEKTKIKEVFLSSTLGKKKRIEMLKKAKEMGIKILNRMEK